MPVSYINSTSGSQTSAAGSGTLTLTLPTSAPTTGQWLFVAITTNDHNSMGPQTPIKCGTVTLSTLELGFITVPVSSRVPYVCGAPYQSGMTQSITIPWTNNPGASRSIYACALVLSGLAATPTSAYAHLKSYNTNGLFDGSSGFYDLGSLNSNGTDGSFFNMLAFANSAGISTSYDNQKQPFILATWQTGATTAPSTLNGAATISSGVITTSGQASGTVVLASATTYGTTGTAYLLTTDGVLPFTWTGKSGNNLTGCSIAGGSASGFYNYSLTSGTGASINHPVLLSTNSVTGPQPLKGWQMGVNATTALGVNISTAAVSGVQAAGQLTLSFGQSGGLSTTPAYLITEAITAAGAVMMTAIPSTRTMSRSSTSTNILTDLATRAITRGRTAIATMLRSASASKVKTSNRTATATHVRVAKASRTVAALRTAKATLINVSREARQVYYLVATAALAVLADYDIKTVNRVKQAIATLSRASRVSKVTTVTKRASQAVIGASQAIKAATFRRSAKATAVNSFTVSKTVLRTRRANAVAVYAISSSKSRTFTRRAIATAVALARVAKVYTPFITHPGYVSAAITTASVKSAVKTASVSSDVETASVRSQVKTATVASDVKTATVSSSVKPLV